MFFLWAVKIWLWISVLATAAGWILSAIGALNRAGYNIFFGLGVILLFVLRKELGLHLVSFSSSLASVQSSSFKVQGSRFSLFHRFRRPLPFLFLLLTILIFLGGTLYPASNHTALSYRTPRVLNWLAEGHWCWIHTDNY